MNLRIKEKQIFMSVYTLETSLSCDFLRKYTGMQLRIGWGAKVFPLHTVLNF